MMTLRLSLAALILILAGCSGAATSGVRYDAALDQTVFRSPALSLGSPFAGGALGAARITLSVEAACAGEGCAPETYEVSLARSGGGASMSDIEQVAFDTDEGTVLFTSDTRSDGVAHFFGTAQGEFVRLSLPPDVFASFAESPTLTVRVGSSSYRLAYGNRASLRRLLPGAGA